MLLAIDSGNTNIVFAVFDGDALRGTWRLESNPRRTADELAIWVTQFFALAGLARTDIDGVAIANVVPEATHSLTRLARHYFDCPPVIVGDPGIDLGVRALIRRPEEVGADRLVNAMAANRLYGGPLIVIDFGTATTFDVVDANGNYCGGAICPGINLSLQALRLAAAKLPGIDIRKPDAVIGQTTVEAMQSGVFWGYIGLIEGIVQRTRCAFTAAAGAPPAAIKVIGTGGLAPLFAEATDVIEQTDGELTLKGLAMIHAGNAGRGRTESVIGESRA